MNKFNEQFNLICESVSKSEGRWRKIEYLIPDFPYKGFSIGRSNKAFGILSTCQAGGGELQFGDFIVWYKSPIPKGEQLALCPLHFCKEFDVDYDELMQKYIDSAGWKSMGTLPLEWQEDKQNKEIFNKQGNIFVKHKDPDLAYCESEEDNPSRWNYLKDIILDEQEQYKNK